MKSEREIKSENERKGELERWRVEKNMKERNNLNRVILSGKSFFYFVFMTIMLLKH